MPRYVPRFRKKIATSYTSRRARRRKHQAPRTERAQPDSTALREASDLSPLGAIEFPVAMVRPREARAQIIVAIAALQRWLIARWQWFKPRTMPCVVAGLGLLAVITLADYLAHHIDQPKPEKQQKLLLVDIANR